MKSNIMELEYQLDKLTNEAIQSMFVRQALGNNIEQNVSYKKELEVLEEILENSIKNTKLNIIEMFKKETNNGD